MAQVDALKVAGQAIQDAAAKVQPTIDALKAKNVPEDPAVQTTIDAVTAQVTAAAATVEAAVASAGV